MADTTITSANSVVTITVPSLAIVAQLQGFSAERAWNSNQQDLAETQMGVDGRQTAGYTPAPVEQMFSLQADSPSKQVFKAIGAAMIASRDVFYISCDISIPATGEAFTGRRGVLINWKAIPDAAKVLQPMDFAIRWESLKPTLL